MYIGIPQFIFIVWMIIALCCSSVKKEASEFGLDFITVVIIFVLLYFGGFFG